MAINKDFIIPDAGLQVGTSAIVNSYVQVGNSSTYANLSSSNLTIGTFWANGSWLSLQGTISTYTVNAATQINVGPDIAAGYARVNTTSFAVGNTLSNSTITSTTIGIATINSTSSGFYTNSTYIGVGNSSVNAVITPSTLRIGNSSSFTNITATALTTNGTFAATGAATFSNNVTINGNLTVTGTTTYINTSTLNIADNIITLNSDVTGVPSENAGVEINRGTSANVQLRWNESNTRWQVTTDGTTFGNIHTTLVDVALGTDTSGNYVASLIEGTGITITNNTGEGATPTISLSQSVAPTSDVTFNTVTVGNSTINAYTTGTQLKVSNASHNTVVTSSDITIGNTTVNTTLDLNQVEIGTINATSAGFKANSGGIIFGNSTVNVIFSSNSLTISNSTFNSILDLNQVEVGSINSTSSGFIGNTSYIGVGNSSVNTTATPSLIKIANATVSANISTAGFITGITTANQTAVSIGANVIATATNLYVGNSTVNAVHSQSSLIVANATVNTSIGIASAQFGNTTFYAGANQTSLTVANATVTSVVGAATLALGNSTVNTSISQTDFTGRNTSGNWFVANSTSVNAVSFTIGTNFVANSSYLYTAGTANVGGVLYATAGLSTTFANVSGQVNTATIVTTGIANIGGVLYATVGSVTTGQANTTNVYASGTANIAGTFLANSLGTTVSTFVNVASDSAVLRVGNATNYSTTNTSGLYPASNTVTNALGTAAARWTISAVSGDFSTNIVAGGYINVASDSAVLRVGNATNYSTTNTSGLYPASNTVSNALGAAAARWALNATTGNFSGLITADAGVSTTFANVSGQVNTAGVSTTWANVSGQVNTATIVTTGIANVGGVFYATAGSITTGQANTTNVYASGTANIAGAFLANSLGTTVSTFINVASDSAVLRVGNATSFSTSNTSGHYPASNTLGNALGAAGSRWALNATTGDFNSTLNVSGVTTIAANLAVATNDLFVDTVNSRVGINTTTPAVALDVVGAANVSSTLQVGGITTLGANLVLANNTLSNPTIKAYREAANITATFAGGTTTLDINAHNIFKIAMSSNTTLALSNPAPAGSLHTVTLIVECDVGSAATRVITWPASVKWPGGSAATLTGTSNTDIFTLMTVDGGTTYYGAVSLASL